MKDSELFEYASDFVRKNCDADDFTFRIISIDSLETRFAQNAITQHITGKNFRINLQVAYGSRTGQATVNQSGDESLKFMLDTAQEMARLNQPDPEYVPSEPAHDLKDINNFSEETAGLEMGQLVDNIEKCVKNAKDKKAKVSGMAEKHVVNSYLTTRNGFEGSDLSSEFSHSMTIKKDEVETKVSRSLKNYGNFDIEDLISRINSQFDSLRKPEPFPARKIPVIIRPGALLREFIQFLLMMMDMRDADEGVSPFTGQLNQKFFGDKFTLSSTLEDPDLISARFLSGGTPTQNMNWVNEGVLENMPVSRYYAREKNIKPAAPYNVFIPGGGQSEEEMIQMVDEGLIINKFFYIRYVDQKRGELTGMTRDGVLYFKDGKIRHSVNNLRFNEIPHEVTRRILALGESVLQTSTAKIPTMLVDDFNFVDATTF